VRDQVLHPHEETGTVMFVYILDSLLFYIKQTERLL
jgi:hypothetical protein